LKIRTGFFSFGVENLTLITRKFQEKKFTLTVGVLNVLMNNQGRDLLSLENKLDVLLEPDVSDKSLTVIYATDSKKDIVSLLTRELERKELALKNESLEYAIAGSTRAVVGVGCATTMILMNDEYTRINLCNIPNDPFETGVFYALQHQPTQKTL
jgi:hypothetical protein